MKKIRKYLDKFFEHMRQLLQTNVYYVERRAMA